MIRFVILCLIFCSKSLWSHYDVSICAIFRDEGPFLKEWIEFHKMQGVEHFYLYNNLSSDDYLAVLEPYGDEITLIDWPFSFSEPQKTLSGINHFAKIQSAAYMHCISHYGEETKWVAMIDTDEFLFCPNGLPLPEFLKSYEEWGGVAVNWLLFGTSNIECLPPDTLQIEALTRCARRGHTRNRYIKQIAQPSAVADCNNPHFFYYKEGSYCTTVLGEKIGATMKSKRLSLDTLRINHYWTRTEKYFREKKLDRRLSILELNTRNQLLQQGKSYNRKRDEAILQFVPELRRRMGYESED